MTKQLKQVLEFHNKTNSFYQSEPQQSIPSDVAQSRIRLI